MRSDGLNSDRLPAFNRVQKKGSENTRIMTKKYEINMCEGPLLPKLVLFAVPLMLSSILQLLYNAADVIVVGRFAGSSALAAVSSTGSLINLIVNLFIGLSVGANVAAARFFGAKDERGVHEVVHTWKA